MTDPQPDHPATHPVPWLAITLIAAATLALELALIRLFSFSQWHHFAFLVVSLALLGFAVGGNLVSLFQISLLRHFERSLRLCLGGFCVAAVVCPWLAQSLEFNSLAVIWNPRQWWILAQMLLLLAVPFVLAAVAITLILCRFPGRVGPLYGADLLGAGLGALLITLAMYRLTPGELPFLAALGGVLALLTSRCLWRRRLAQWSLLVLVSATLLGLGWLQSPQSALSRSAEFKPLSKTLLTPGSRVRSQHPGPSALLTVVENPRVPLRITPGMSLANRATPPDQLGVFIDAAGPVALDRYDGRDSTARYLENASQVLPYYLLDRPAVALLGLHGNQPLIAAHHFGARRVDIVEPDAPLIDLLTETYPQAAGWEHLRRHTRLHHQTLRGFFNRTQQRFDLIQLPRVSARGHALESQFHLTREAFTRYFDHLSPGGMLSLDVALQLPPRNALRLLATLDGVLHAAGIEQPGAHIAMIRSWNRINLVASRSALTPDQINQVRRFSEQRRFDLVYLPGMNLDESNRYNQLLDNRFATASRALLGASKTRFIADYPFAIAPATDDRPFFYRFFRWQSAGAIWQGRDTGSLSLMGLGYPVLLIALVLAIVLSVVLIPLPLAFIRPATLPRRQRAPLILYFAAIGLGFFMVEIVLLQWFVLFLNQPVLSAAVVTATLLVFAGAGSLLSPHCARLTGGRAAPVLLAIGALILLATLGLPPLFRALADTSPGIRIAVSILSIAPLGLLMGMPMPLGLRQLCAGRASLIAWAWAINGCFSVIGGVLTTLLALHLGFATVLMLAAGTYGAGALAIRVGNGKL